MHNICDDEVIPKVIAEAKQATLTTIGARTHAEKWGDYAKAQGDRVENHIKTIAKGDKGDKGDTGEKGDIGLTGLRGEKGEQGIQGEKGDTGDKGDTGERGLTGEKGDPGTGSVSTVNGIQPTNGNVDIDLAPLATDADLTAHAEKLSHVHYANDTGTANAKVITLDAVLATLPVGLGVSFKNTLANTGATTINVNGLGIKPIVNSKGGALTSGKLVVNGIYTLRYNGTSFILQGEGGEYGTATAGDVLSGKTIGTEDGLKSGNVISHPEELIPTSYYVGNVGALYANIPKGAYLADSGAPVGGATGATHSLIKMPEPNFIASNILANKNIFGLQGSIPVQTGAVLATGTAQWGDGQLAVYIPPGNYYAPGSELKVSLAQLQVAEGDLQAGNIKAGVNLFGLLGTLASASGFRKASGTVTAPPNGDGFHVNGLSFLPSNVVLRKITNLAQSTQASEIIVVDFSGGIPMYNTRVPMIRFKYDYSGAGYFPNYTPMQLQDGFRIPNGGYEISQTYEWEAWE